MFLFKLLENTSDKIEILDVGCGSGQMICAIVNSSNVNCVVDGLDNFQERDTHKITFENHNFTRKLYEVDFNKIQNFTKNKYDYIFGLNSIRMSTNIEQTLRFLSNYLKPNGKIVFNTITEEFQNKFFESSYEIAKKGKHLLEKRLSSGKNYIPEFYNKEKILKVAKNTGLNLNGYYTYLFLDKFSHTIFLSQVINFYTVFQLCKKLGQKYGRIVLNSLQ